MSQETTIIDAEPKNPALAEALEAAAEINPEAPVSKMMELDHEVANLIDRVEASATLNGVVLENSLKKITSEIGAYAYAQFQDTNMTLPDAVIYAFDSLGKNLRNELVERFNPKLDESSSKIETHLTDRLADIGKAVEVLDEFSQARMLQDIGRGFINAIGWNRAFRERILYGTAQYALDLNNQEDCEKDETGVFIGYYGEDELDPDGHPIETAFDRLTDNQKELLEQMEVKEDQIWNAFDLAKEAFEDIQGNKALYIRASNAQKEAGVRNLEDMVEYQKRYALEWHANRDVEEANRQKARNSALRNLTANDRAHARKEREHTSV